MDERTDPSLGTTGTPVTTPGTPGIEPQSQRTTEQAASAAKEQAQEVAGTAAEAARGVAAEAGQQVRQVASEASRQARGLADQAREQARQQADNQTQRAAQSLQALSQQFRALAEGRQEESGEAHKYLQWFADRAGEMGRHLETTGLDGLVADIKSFARRRPGLFLAGAAATGFVVSRVAKSSQGAQSEQESFSPAALAGGELSAEATLAQETTRIGDLPVAPVTAPADIDPSVVRTDVDSSVVESSENARSSVGAADQDDARGGM